MFIQAQQVIVVHLKCGLSGMPRSTKRFSQAAKKAATKAPTATTTTTTPKKKQRTARKTKKGKDVIGGRKKTARPPVDAAWIVARCKELGLTQADLARALRRDSSMITRSLQGARSFDGSDIAGLAQTLQVSTDEIHRRLGHPVPRRGVIVAGKITGDAKVSTVSARKGATVRNLELPPDAEAYVAETEGTALEPYHGATFVVSAMDARNPAPFEAFGRLCIVEADNNLVPYLGTLSKASTRAAVRLTLFGTGGVVTVREVHRASPVLAIFFA